MKKKLLLSIGIHLAILGLMFTTQGFAAINPADAAGIWLFDGDTSDSSGNGNDGVLMNGAAIVDDALSLDGDDDYVNVAASASLDGTADNYTGVAWIKFERKSGPQPGACCQDDQMVLAFSTNWHNILNVFGRDRGIPGAIEVGSGELAPSWLSGPTSVDDNEWHHIAFTYDGATKVIYVDGEVDVDAATTGSFGVSGIDLHIGGTPTAERPANGLIDDVGIFNVPLAQGDIQDIMNNGLAAAIGIETAVDPRGRLTTTWADIKSQR